MIAFDSSGRHLVLADDDELLVHDGLTEAPRWLRAGACPLVAVGATAEHIISVDEDGQVTWYDPVSDTVQARADAGELARAGAVSPAGHVAVATSEGAALLSPSGPARSIAWPGASAVAWGPDERLLVADDAGKVGIFAAGARVDAAELDGPAVAAVWSPRGFWLLATATELVRLEGGALHHLTSAPADAPIRHLACSADGDAIAITLGDALVIALSWPARDPLGQLRYLDRHVTGLAFGIDRWLAVGLDGGDGNKFDLRTGDLHRTDTQPGREHRRWMVQVSTGAPDRPPEDPPSPAAASAAIKNSSSLATVVVLIAIALALFAWLAR